MASTGANPAAVLPESLTSHGAYQADCALSYMGAKLMPVQHELHQRCSIRCSLLEVRYHCVSMIACSAVIHMHSGAPEAMPTYGNGVVKQLCAMPLCTAVAQPFGCRCWLCSAGRMHQQWWLCTAARPQHHGVRAEPSTAESSYGSSE